VAFDYGDSGSPQFVPGTNMIVSTTSGGDVNCRATNYTYRLDTAGAREFLGQFLPWGRPGEFVSRLTTQVSRHDLGTV